MEFNPQASSVKSHWLFWSVSLLLVLITALVTFSMLDNTSSLPFVVDGIGLVAPSCLARFGCVLFLALRNRQIKKSIQTGILIVFTGTVGAILINMLLINPIWQAQRPPCQIQCGNSNVITTLEILWPLIGLLAGIIAASFAGLLGWIMLRLRRN